QIAQYRMKLGMRSRGCLPIPKLLHISCVFFFLVGRQISQLVTQGVGTNSAGSSGGGLGGRNDDFRGILVHRAGSAEQAVLIEGNFQVSPGYNVANGSQNCMSVSIFPYIRLVTIVGFHRLLERSE